jgi:hypothetical protein
MCCYIEPKVENERGCRVYLNKYIIFLMDEVCSKGHNSMVSVRPLEDKRH